MNLIKRNYKKFLILLTTILSSEAFAQSFDPAARSFNDKLTRVFWVVVPIAIAYAAFELKFGDDGGNKGKTRVKLTLGAIFLVTVGGGLVSLFR